MSFRLQVKNYRGLRTVDWSPEGVCALVGANGSGKTTLLDVPSMLAAALDRGLARALEEHGGIANARNLYASDTEPYEFSVSLGDVTWRLEPVLSETGFRSGETVVVGRETLVSREVGADSATILGVLEPVRDALALAVATQQAPVGSTALATSFTLARLLARYRVYGAFDFDTLRRHGSPDSSERRLNSRGTNVFSVLRNWRDKKGDRERYEFVVEALREMFADFFDDLEFEKAAQIVGASIVLKHDRVHSASLAPDGWFAALLGLTALASTSPGEVLAIDEPENALHPHAIRLLLERMRRWSRLRSVTVLLATHSPVIISDFDTRPDQLFVMQPEGSVSPVSVVELKDRDWLAHFTLGDLYMREEFGAPENDDDRRADHNG